MKTFRTDGPTEFRANKASPQGTIYPQEVVADMVQVAQGAVEARQMLVFPESDEDLEDLTKTLGVVTRLDLVFGWLEIDVEPISMSQRIPGGAVNILDSPEAEGLFSVYPGTRIVRSNNTGALVIHEAIIEGFSLYAIPSRPLSHLVRGDALWGSVLGLPPGFGPIKNA
jgi:hypothetical protein